MKDDFEYAVLNSESHNHWFSTEICLHFIYCEQD